MKKKKTNRKQKQGGFTLVELVVVLAILSILAAVTVPSLLGFMDRGREQTLILNGKSAYLAAETLAGERFLEGEPYPTSEEIMELAQGSGRVTSLYFDSERGKVKATGEEPFCYEEDGKTVMLADGSWSIVEESHRENKE